MRAWATLGVGVTVVLFSCSRARAAVPSFQGLGDLPGGEFSSCAYGVSADGSVVVGRSVIDTSAGIHHFEAFRWENGVISGLGDLPGGALDSQAYAVSADGSVVVGWGSGGAFRWENGIMSALGGSWAMGVSADGSVVVGLGSGGAFRWENGVMSPLGGREARDVSADGSVVVGTARSGISYGPVRWENGVMTALGYLPGAPPNASGFATAVSPDGSVIVGASSSEASSGWWEGFRWKNGVMTALGGFPREYFILSRAYDVSGDGSVVVGESANGGAFIWTTATGMLSLEGVLTALGLDLTGWSLGQATGISDDGLTVVGGGQSDSPYGFQGWIATLPADWIEQVTYELTVSIAKSHWVGWGTVTVEPNLERYFVGKTVTLTAEPGERTAFKKWKLDDPNHPGHGNHFVTDTNNPLTLVMTADRQVVAVFKCAPAGRPPFLSMTLGLLGLIWVVRRRR